MAADAETIVDNPTSTETPESSSTQGALSAAEMRDIETFARNGMNPDGSPLQRQPQADPADADEPDESKTPDATDADDATAVDDEEDEDIDVEITDEQLDRYVDALLELNADKLAKNPRLRERLEQEIRAQVEADSEAKQRAASASQERERLTVQGRQAVDAVFNLMTNAQTAFTKAEAELAKAAEGEQFNAKVIADAFKFDPKELEQHLGIFAASAVGDLRRSYDDAFSNGFRAAVTVAGPISEEEREAVVNIVNTANRIEADEKQGPGRFDKAKDYLYSETFKLVTGRAFEAGKAAAIAEAKAKRAAAKTVLDADAVLAGAAKEARARRQMPPSPTAPGATPDAGAATIEAYRAAKAAGDFDLADSIMLKMQMSAPPEAQRRLRR